MFKSYPVILITAAVAIGIYACKTPKAVYKQVNGGLEYRIIRDRPGGQRPEAGDVVDIHSRSYLRRPAGDSLLFDSRSTNGASPLHYSVLPPSFVRDISQGLVLLTVGDSAEFRIDVDSMIVDAGNRSHSWMQRGKGHKIIYTISVVDLHKKGQAQQAGGRK